jgi:hypothetical protein
VLDAFVTIERPAGCFLNGVDDIADTSHPLSFIASAYCQELCPCSGLNRHFFKHL